MSKSFYNVVINKEDYQGLQIVFGKFTDIPEIKNALSYYLESTDCENNSKQISELAICFLTAGEELLKACSDFTKNEVKLDFFWLSEGTYWVVKRCINFFSKLNKTKFNSLFPNKNQGCERLFLQEFIQRADRLFNCEFDERRDCIGYEFYGAYGKKINQAEQPKQTEKNDYKS